jgi:thioredoxin-related protein
VDRIEAELEGEAEVMRLSVASDPGLALAQRYGVRGVPTLLVFDGAGNVVYTRVGLPNVEEVVQVVRGQ